MSNVLITGADRGIGLALTHVYASRGDTVLACCRAPRRATELATHRARRGAYCTRLKTQAPET